MSLWIELTLVLLVVFLSKPQLIFLLVARVQCNHLFALVLFKELIDSEGSRHQLTLVYRRHRLALVQSRHQLALIQSRNQLVLVYSRYRLVLLMLPASETKIWTTALQKPLRLLLSRDRNLVASILCLHEITPQMRNRTKEYGASEHISLERTKR
jgi:hypothetical protein